MSKRQRTVSSSNEGPIDKRQRPDDEPADTRAAPPKVSPIYSISDQEGSQKLINNATGGRTLRARPRKEQTTLSVEDENESTSEDEGGSVYGEVAKKKKSSAPITFQERKLIKQILRIERKDMKKSFNDWKIPYCMANPPHRSKDGTIEERDDTGDSDESFNAAAPDSADSVLNKSKPLGKQPGKGKRVFASTVTKDDLKPFGWRFKDLTLQETRPPISPEFNATHIYTPISLEKSPIAPTVSPFKRANIGSLDKGNGTKGGKDKNQDAKDEPKQEAKPPKPQGNIIKAWTWALEKLNADGWLEIPLEWGLASESLKGFHVRPEIPPDFNSFVEPENIDTPAGNDASPFSSLEPTPVKTGGEFSGTSRLAEFRNKGLHLDVIHEQAEVTFASQEAQNELSEPSMVRDVDLDPLNLPRKPSPGPFSGIANQSMASNSINGEKTLKKALTRVPDARPQYQAAEDFIKTHKLKLTVKDARYLEEHVLQLQRECDLEKSKRLLCQELGPVTGNRTSDDSAGWHGFVYVPMKDIEDRDRQDHTGNAAKTANATDIRNTAMELNLRWAQFTGTEGNVKGEAMTERKIGNLFTGLFAFDDLEETANTALRFPSHLLLFSTTPRPDYGVRAGGDQWSHWPATLLPMVASGDNKNPDDATGDTEAQLACNMRPTLILEILMYLDTRPTADSPLPAWMWTFSWISTGEGFIIYVHYPSPKLVEGSMDWRWTMVSLILTKKYRRIWKRNSKEKCARAKAAIDLMVSHTGHVHSQILTWSASRGQFGEGSIMNQLLARAEYEQGNFKRLREWAKEMDEAYEEKKCLILGAGVAT